jgi:hypothetical protein
MVTRVHVEHQGAKCIPVGASLDLGEPSVSLAGLLVRIAADAEAAKPGEANLGGLVATVGRFFEETRSFLCVCIDTDAEFVAVRKCACSFDQAARVDSANQTESLLLVLVDPDAVAVARAQAKHTLETQLIYRRLVHAERFCFVALHAIKTELQQKSAVNEVRRHDRMDSPGGFVKFNPC